MINFVSFEKNYSVFASHDMSHSFDFSEGKKELVSVFNVEYSEGGNVLFTLVAGCIDCFRGLG